MHRAINKYGKEADELFVGLSHPTPYPQNTHNHANARISCKCANTQLYILWRAYLSFCEPTPSVARKSSDHKRIYQSTAYLRGCLTNGWPYWPNSNPHEFKTASECTGSAASVGPIRGESQSSKIQNFLLFRLLDLWTDYWLRITDINDTFWT